MKIRCAIVDDEFLARQYLTDYVSKIPFLELVDDFDSPLKAMDLIKSGGVDLLFLDIQMPDISGLEFLKTLDKQPLVIFTTAYKEYALEGYELNVTDYLLKPFSFDRFLKAVNKVAKYMEGSKDEPTTEQPTPKLYDDYLTIRADRKHYKINYDDLIYIEGQKAYVTFHTTSKKVTALASLKQLEDKLPQKQFIRIHKSFIVSKKYIDALEGNILEMKNEKLPVGKSYKGDVEKVFGI
jgi:DNA-binding LytR/AlgR family response regulator